MDISDLTWDPINIFIALIAALIVLGRYVYNKLNQKGLSLPGLVPDIDGPILAAGVMLTEGRLQSVYQGEIAGYSVNVMSNSANTTMAYVQLGRNTEIHLVAIGDRSGLTARLQNYSSSFLVPVRLEGYFPKYFQLYCSPSKQVEVRQVFEPATMQRFVDFCRNNDLEILNETLFISQAADAVKANDSTNMIADLTTFLEKNTAVLQRL